MCIHKQEGRNGVADPESRRADATMTLWRRLVDKDSTSEDSIRVSANAVTSAGTTTPRPRYLSASEGQEPDFELGELLGSGGMGVVYMATQTALGRGVALKMVKPGQKGAAVAADALMSEAVVTGGLEHPNIVPVYDLGVDADGNLFYAMKQVQGLPWSKLLSEKTQDENLEILLRVADTISFAHSRGVLHRDLKPHNIMLGDFGEVMVMDWGASCRMTDLCAESGPGAESSFCGTPAYMPPEMARGDINRLSEASDIYLLGAILYQIVTGHPPRIEKDPVLCLAQAAENHIESAADGELYRIALTAMASAPADRFPDVRSFQQAIQDYRSHSESLRLTENAAINWRKAKYERDYDLFNRAVFGFREALDLWPQNSDAENMLKNAVEDHARCAFDHNDLELAQSLLSSSDPAHRDLLNRIAGAIADQDAHRRRHRRLLLVARLMGIGLLLIFSAAFFLIRSEQKKTREEHRESLVNLIAAHYGEQNYEAAVFSFWQLYDQYGMESLDEELQLDVRVAAAMNPSRGIVTTGLSEPLGLVPAVESNCVWVIGRRQIKRLKLTPDTGYDPDTLVSIHDFSFGKRLPPGKVLEAIDLPARIGSSAAVHESSDGTLWAGWDSKVWRYSRQDQTWDPVLDIHELELEPLPAAYEYGSDQADEFLLRMKAFSRERPITGIFTTRDQSKAAVVLGGEAICWIDLQAKQCLGWFFSGMETGWKERAMDRAPALALSPDENWLLFRNASGGSFVYIFRLPDFICCRYFYGRDFPILDIAFAGNDRFFGMDQWQGRIFSPVEQDFAHRIDLYIFDTKNPGLWGPENSSVRNLPVRIWKHASLNVNEKECAVITSDNHLFAGSLENEKGPDRLVHLMNRKWIDMLLPAAGQVYALDDAGRVHVYSTHRFAVQTLAQDDRCTGVGAGRNSDTFYGLFERSDGSKRILKICGARSKSVTSEVLVPNTDALKIYGDPSGRFVAALVSDGVRVYDAQSGNELAFLTLDRKSDKSPIMFDEHGSYLAIGGQWSHWLYIYRTSDWECILAENQKAYLDVEMDYDAEGSARLLLTRGHTFEVSRIAAERPASSNLLWRVDYPQAMPFIIPCADGDFSDRFYWLGGWFDKFWKADLKEDGRTVAKTDYWRKKGIRWPVYGINAAEAFLQMEDGQVQMVLKSDLLPVADPRLFGEGLSEVVPGTDGSVLALVRDGRMELMNLDEMIEQFPVCGKP